MDGMGINFSLSGSVLDKKGGREVLWQYLFLYPFSLRFCTH